MARAVEQITRDIAALEESVVAIAQEFDTTYTQYLVSLGQAVRQQLILASYHLCTQGYPDRFLQLSFNQRQQLQQVLRQLAQQAQAELVTSAQHPLDDLTSEETFLESTDSESFDAPFEQEEPAAIPVSSEDESADAQKALVFPQNLEKQPANLKHQPMSPKGLLLWQENLEEVTAEILQALSHAANRLLQQSDVLPNKLPEPILEVAAKASVGAETAAGPPNILNLLIETGTEDDDEAEVTHIMAIRLRLSEIEFGDPTVTSWRSKIRGLSTRLNHLGREYQKKQREREIAEAEAAWRSSWFDE